MGCRRLLPEVFEDYAVRDPEWDGDIKYYIVRQCLGFVLDMDDSELATEVSPDTNFVCKYNMEKDDRFLWVEFSFYLSVQFELEPISEYYIYRLSTLRRATDYVLKHYSDELLFLKELWEENPAEAKFQEDERKGRVNAYRLERAREIRFNELIKNPVYKFFHDLELKLYPRKEVIPEIRYLDCTDFSGFFRPYQYYYKRYRHISIKYRWQIKKAYQKRHAKHIAYETVRKMITFRKAYYRSSWDRNYMSYHDYDAWLAYLKEEGNKYEIEYKREEKERRNKRKLKKRRKGVNGGRPRKPGERVKFYCGTYLRNHKDKYLDLGYRFFDKPKKRYWEYPI